MKILQVIQSAFRTLVEEQDDTIVWLSENLRCAGADISVLLRGHACLYAVQSKVQPALHLGDWVQTQPADLTRDFANLTDFKVPVYVVEEDLRERGLAGRKCLPGVQVINKKQLTEVYESADQVWNW